LISDGVNGGTYVIASADGFIALGEASRSSQDRRDAYY
jgi:hypothetical protein